VVSIGKCPHKVGEVELMAEQDYFEELERIRRQGGRRGALRQTGPGAAAADFMWSPEGMALEIPLGVAAGSAAKTGKELLQKGAAGAKLGDLQDVFKSNYLRRGMMSPLLRGLGKGGLLRAASMLHPAGRGAQAVLAAAPMLLNMLASSGAINPREKRERWDMATDFGLGGQASTALLGGGFAAPAVLGAGGKLAKGIGRGIAKRGQSIGKRASSLLGLQDEAVDLAKKADDFVGPPVPPMPTPKVARRLTGKRVFGEEREALDAAGYTPDLKGKTWDIANKGPFKDSPVDMEGKLLHTEFFMGGMRDVANDSPRLAHRIRDRIQELAPEGGGELDLSRFVDRVAESFKGLDFGKGKGAKKAREALMAALDDLGLGGSPQGRDSIYEAIARRLEAGATGARKLKSRVARNTGKNRRPGGRNLG
jgi:hypothetical protein